MCVHFPKKNVHAPEGQATRVANGFQSALTLHRWPATPCVWTIGDRSIIIDLRSKAGGSWEVLYWYQQHETFRAWIGFLLDWTHASFAWAWLRRPQHLSAASHSPRSAGWSWNAVRENYCSARGYKTSRTQWLSTPWMYYGRRRQSSNCCQNGTAL